MGRPAHANGSAISGICGERESMAPLASTAALVDAKSRPAARSAVTASPSAACRRSSGLAARSAIAANSAVIDANALRTSASILARASTSSAPSRARRSRLPPPSTTSAHATPVRPMRRSLRATGSFYGVPRTLRRSCASRDRRRREVELDTPVSFRHPIKAALKRGSLVAAANWPVTLVQSVADALFKLLIAVHWSAAWYSATLVIGADTDALVTLDWRVLAATVVTSLLSHRLVLAAFLLALAVVIIGGSVFVFLVKGGTVGVLVRGDRTGGRVETPPLQFEVVATAATYSVELFVESAQSRCFSRYARLGFTLMAVYLASGAAFITAHGGQPDAPARDGESPRS